MIGVDEEHNPKRDFVVQRAKNLYEKLERSDQNDETRAKLLKEQLVKIEKELVEEVGVRESFEGAKKEALTSLEKEFASLVGSYRKEVSSRTGVLETKVDEDFSKIRANIHQEQRKRGDNQSDALRNVNDHIAELNGMIAAQRKNR